MAEDGTLIEGGNKLVMYDEKMETVPTGSLSTYIVLGSLGLVSILGIGTYIYLKKKKINRVLKTNTDIDLKGLLDG